MPVNDQRRDSGETADIKTTGVGTSESCSLHIRPNGTKYWPQFSGPRTVVVQKWDITFLSVDALHTTNEIGAHV